MTSVISIKPYRKLQAPLGELQTRKNKTLEIWKYRADLPEDASPLMFLSPALRLLGLSAIAQMRFCSTNQVVEVGLLHLSFLVSDLGLTQKK
jgi:hypothetical protein